jgi:isopenicillin-N N-acyltransferase-like protein
MTLERLALRGTPTERGRTHGEAFAAEIRTNVECYLDRFAHYGIEADRAREMAAEFVPLVADADAAYAAEMEAIADASGVPLVDVALLNARYEVMYAAYADAAADGADPEPDGCTSFAVRGDVTTDGRPRMGQNWDWIPGIEGFVMDVRGGDVADHVAFTEAGIVGGKIGVNEHGIAMALNGLVTAADGEHPFRKPYHVRFREVLDADRLSEAVGAIVEGSRACSANVVLGAAAGEFLNLEALPESVTYVEPRDGILTHANHLEAATEATSRFEQLLPDTVCRSPRLQRLLERGAPTLTEADLKDALRDHFDEPSSICRHVDPALPDEEQTVTRVSAVIDIAEGRLDVTDGAPCEATYRSFALADAEENATTGTR